MRRSGVRIPLAPPQADIRSGCRFFVCLGAFVRCLLLCCLWLRWCSGRRRARPPARLGDLTSFGAAPRSPPVPSGPSGALHTGDAWLLMASQSVVSKPGQDPPPPTSTAAVPCGPSGALHLGGACGAAWPALAPPPPFTPVRPGVLVCSERHLDAWTGPAAAHSTAAMPSGPSGVLHTGNAWSADVRLGASPRSPARPRRRHHPRLGRRNLLQRTPPHHPLPQHLGLTPQPTRFVL